VEIVPPKDNALPCHTTSASIVIPESSILLPAKVEKAPNVVAPPGVHQISHAVEPFNNTDDEATVVRAPVILKTYVPFPLRLIPAVPIEEAPVIQYTPGV